MSCIPVMGIYYTAGAFIYGSMVRGFVRLKFNIRIIVSIIMLIYTCNGPSAFTFWVKFCANQVLMSSGRFGITLLFVLVNGF